MSPLSFPVRERGLKHAVVCASDQIDHVVPRAGTWIETLNGTTHQRQWFESFPVRERGLKHSLR